MITLHGFIRQIALAAVGKQRPAAESLRLWQTMTIRPECRTEVEATARKHLLYRQRYEGVAADTGVPWFLIAALHDQECIQPERFDRYLGNGQMLNRRTTIVPANRGPFATWEDGARDALMMKRRYFPKKWTIGELLTFAEGYNGWGYYWRGIASPYVWCYTNHYSVGHYVRDHVFSMKPRDARKKPGVATLIKVWVEQGVVRVESDDERA